MNTALATRVNAALASLGQQTSHSLQSLCFIPCNATYYFKYLGIKLCDNTIPCEIRYRFGIFSNMFFLLKKFRITQAFLELDILFRVESRKNKIGKVGIRYVTFGPQLKISPNTPEIQNP